jgi:TonB family protein
VTLGLPRSVGVSAAAHAALLLGAAVFGPLFAPKLPVITEITLVSGPGAGPAPSGAVVTPRPGGRRGTSAVSTVKRAAKGSVSIATPEFVPVGRKPRRSGEELMGAGPGDGGAAGPTMGAGPASGGAGRLVKYAEPLEYPDWAKEQGIDAKVVLIIKVMPNGSVDPNIVVTRTSGWRQLDELAIRTLRQYQFAPLPHDAPQVAQGGTITLHFKAE